MSELKTEKKIHFSKAITREQSKDTGLALMLILLLVGYFTGNALFYKLSIPVLLIVMITPGWFYPIAILWFGLSSLIGTFMSQVLLTIIYYILVVPIATIRNLMGIDSLKIRQFHKGTNTVMQIRNHVYNSSDIEKPY